MLYRVLLSWSSGKDSAWALHVLRNDPQVEVVGLLSTVNTAYGRVAMHSTRLELLRAQAQAVGLPLHIVPLPWPCSNEVYEAAMRKAIEDALEHGVTHIAFGDLFLEDVRAYRVKQLEGSGLEPLFPIWHEPTGPLARRMIDAGLQAVITCIDPRSSRARLPVAGLTTHCSMNCPKVWTPVARTESFTPASWPGRCSASHCTPQLARR
jgi:diphthamide synthase (EF-2-diphthine--ammonia ligase)